MKKIIFLISLSVLVFSCANTKFTVLPYYTNVEKIITLQKGDSPLDVNTHLEVPPHNILYMQDGVMLCQYYYRIKERRVNIQNKENFMPRYTENQEANQKEDLSLNSEKSQTFGYTHYTTPQKLYVYFKDDKLQNYITDVGFEKARFLEFNNGVIRLLRDVPLEYEQFTDNFCCGAVTPNLNSINGDNNTLDASLPSQTNQGKLDVKHLLIPLNNDDNTGKFKNVLIFKN